MNINEHVLRQDHCQAWVWMNYCSGSSVGAGGEFTDEQLYKLLLFITLMCVYVGKWSKLHPVNSLPA